MIYRAALKNTLQLNIYNLQKKIYLKIKKNYKGDFNNEN